MMGGTSPYMYLSQEKWVIARNVMELPKIQNYVVRVVPLIFFVFLQVVVETILLDLLSMSPSQFLSLSYCLPPLSSPGSEHLGETKEVPRRLWDNGAPAQDQRQQQVPFPNVSIPLGKGSMKMCCDPHNRENGFRNPRQHHGTETN